MQRAIRFRAWDKFQKKYVFTGFHICGEVTAFGGMEIEIGETWKARSAALGYTSTIEAWDDFVFEQFTGLVDTNKKDIYEGDIVQGIYSGVIIFDEKSASFGLDNSRYTKLKSIYWFNSDFDSSEIVVIGNINENSKFLNNEQED